MGEAGGGGGSGKGGGVAGGGVSLQLTHCFNSVAWQMQ